MPQNCTERSRPFPTNNRKASNYRQSTYFPQVCRGRIYASRGVFPVVRNIRVAARAAYMPPLRMTRKIIITIKPRAGRAPPLPRVFFNVPAARALLIYYLLSFISYLFTCVPPANVQRHKRRPPHRRAGRLRQSAPAGGAAGSSSRPAGVLPPTPASGWVPFG